MIGYGVCIGSEEKFAAFAQRGLRTCAADGAPIAESRDNTSIFSAYNEILDHFVAMSDLEALVLLHEDVELRDPEFETRIRRRLGEDDVAVVGVIGARDVPGLSWWEGTCFGACDETRGRIDFGGGRHDVDVVDGLLLVLSRWAVRNLRFDAATFSGFHAYDLDYCLQARKVGKRVVVEPIDLFHHTKGGYGDVENFRRADAALRAKWALANPADRARIPALAH